MPKAKVSFNIIIPENCELDEVMVYKYKDNDKSVMFADNVEDFDTNPEFSDSDDDADYMPAIDEEDEESDEEADVYENTPLSEKEKAELEAELEKLIADQDLELEWEEYKNEN